LVGCELLLGSTLADCTNGGWLESPIPCTCPFYKKDLEGPSWHCYACLSGHRLLVYSFLSILLAQEISNSLYYFMVMSMEIGQRMCEYIWAVLVLSFLAVLGWCSVAGAFGLYTNSLSHLNLILGIVRISSKHISICFHREPSKQ
jgi:hypothetical protein